MTRRLDAALQWLVVAIFDLLARALNHTPHH